MAAYIIMQILGIAVSVAFIIMICVFKALTQFMPYVTGVYGKLKLSQMVN